MLFRRLMQRENMQSYRYFILFLFVIFQFRINYFESFRGKERAREKAALQFMMKIDEMRWVVWARIVYSHLLKFVCKHQLHKSFKRRAYSFHIHFFSPLHSIPICLIVRQLSTAATTTAKITVATAAMATATPTVSMLRRLRSSVCKQLREWASIYLHDNLNCLLMLFSSIWIDRSYANNNKKRAPI